MPKLHELAERRAICVTEMRSLNESVEKQNRDYNDGETKRHIELKNELTALDRKIEVAKDLAAAERSAPAVLHSGRLGDGAYEQRARQFSLLKAINSRLGDVDVDAGFEREISSEVVRRAGRKFSGIACPDQFFEVEKRTLLVGSTAATLYPLTHRDDLFIDVLRARLIVGQLGATILDNLQGDNEIPRQTGSSVAQWVAEDGSLTETDATFDDITLQPKTVGCMTSFSRRTLINASPSIENLLRNDLASVIANAIDQQAMRGTGASNTPTGITSQSNVLSSSMSTPTWAQTLAMISAIQNVNGDVSPLAWAMSPLSVAKLRSTVRVATTDSVMLMESATTLADYPVGVSTAVGTVGDSPDKGVVIFGSWDQLLVGYWSGVDILLNPYETTAYAKGRVLIRAMRDCDVAVRHPQSFCKATDMPV